MTIQKLNKRTDRRGAVAPLMALLLPLLLLFCGIVVNIAYMQLNRTELRVATDAAARAAGRAFSEHQSVTSAIDMAVSTGALNNVGSQVLLINPDVSGANADGSPGQDEITFGTTARADNGFGRYIFSGANRGSVMNHTAAATSIRVLGKRTEDSRGGSIQMLFAGWGPFSEFQPAVASTATQVDRDIALVLDRSGSMLEYKDVQRLSDLCWWLFLEGRITWSEYFNGGRFWTSIDRRYFPYIEQHNHVNRKHYELFLDGEVEAWEYAKDMRDRAVWTNWGFRQYGSSRPAARHSRWAQLDTAVDAFLGVLDGTDQEERVSLVSFNNSGRVELPLQSSFETIRDEVSEIKPRDGTNISAGMSVGLTTITNISQNPNARPFAAKTIVVMTDGIHNSGSVRPPAAAAALVQQFNVTIHTVTFTPGVPQSSRDEMAEVARIGGGRHYHADNGEDLVRIFREIANNLPTIITE